jgi:hypothetical protein
MQLYVAYLPVHLRRNYLRLVNRVTTSQTVRPIACVDITKSLQDENIEGQGNSFINQPGTGDDSITTSL